MINFILNSNIDIIHFFILSAILLAISICGIFINRKNIILILMSIELMMLSVNINFVAASVKLGQITGQIFTIFNLTIAAAEAAIGLAILVIFYRNNKTIATDQANKLKG
jgi:NADH-quinone oxidoreductase subunit K